MANPRLRQPLVILAAVCAAAAVPVVPAVVDADPARPSAPSDFELGSRLLQRSGVALTSQHNKLMIDTDVFGLYRDEPSPGPTPAAVASLPALFPDPFTVFSGPALPAVGAPSTSVLKLPPVQWSADAPGGAEGADQADRPTEQGSDSGAEPEQPARKPADEAVARTPSDGPDAPSDGSERRSAAKKKLAADAETLSAGPGLQSDAAEARSARLQESVAPAETVVPHDHQSPAAGHPQPLTLPDTHIFCLLPEPSRHRVAPPAHTKDEPDGRAPAPTAGESGDKPAAGSAAPGAPAADGEEPGAAVPPGGPVAQPGLPTDTQGAEDIPLLAPVYPDQATLDQQPPILYQHPLGNTFQLSLPEDSADADATFNQFWGQFGADFGESVPDGQQVLFQPSPEQPSLSDSEAGPESESLPDPSMFGQKPNKLPTADDAEQGPQEQMHSPTFFAPYRRRQQYPQRHSGYYPTASRAPVATNGWGQPAGRWAADSTWPYSADRSTPTTVSRRTAYPAPWTGSGRGPAGATGWPWPALATESRGQPRRVPSPSGVYFVQQSGRRPAVTGGFPLYSQWYRPTVVPLPGGGSSGGGWWTPAGRFVRPATATATSEESGAGSPPLGANWAWPAVSMLGGRDALVVTGLGRSSGAMARAAGQHGWPPVAMATAGPSRGGGGFSRASSGGFDLIFQDGRFHTGPMALRMSPVEYVPPRKRPKKPTATTAETEDLPVEDGPTKTGAPAGDEGRTLEADEGSGSEEE